MHRVPSRRLGSCTRVQEWRRRPGLNGRCPILEQRCPNTRAPVSQMDFRDCGNAANQDPPGRGLVVSNCLILAKSEVGD
jgi:hypothetical protein